MRKVILGAVLFSFFDTASTAQNVGIGTTIPSEKLEVKNAGTSSIKISSNSTLDTSQLILSNRNASQEGTDFFLKSTREQGLFIGSRSDLPLNNSANSLIISSTGGVGVGIYPAFANKLHVSGTANFDGLLKIEGLNLLEFGAGVAGKEVNAGKIGYNAFGQNALTIVGAGTNATNRTIFMYAEGGTSLFGPLNLLGSMKLNGNEGTPGQVLTSNGAGVPQWAASAFGNQVRFAASYVCPLAAFSFNTVNYTSVYNQSPADVTIGANIITINKSGLYHIEGYAYYYINYSNSQSDIPSANLEVKIGNHFFHFADDEPMGYKSGNAFYKSIPFSQDYYITAPNTINIGPVIGTLPAPINRTSNGIVTGYLISE